MPVESQAISQMAGKTVGGLLGAGQLIGGLFGRSHNERNLNNLANPTYSPNKAISDYYQTALNRYNSGPYNSAFYQTAQKTAQRNLATGISALGDRHSALAGIPGLIEGTDRSMDQAAVQAEAQQRQALGALGSATQMKAGDDRFAFDINQEQPFERRYSELSGKLAANNQMINAGITNLSQGLTGAGGTSAGGLGSSYNNNMNWMGGLGAPSLGQYPAAYNYSPPLANTSGGFQSPASSFPTIPY